MIESDIDWEEVNYVRKNIDKLEFRLKDYYNTRKESITLMSNAGMSNREIGKCWGITGTRVYQILRES